MRLAQLLNQSPEFFAGPSHEPTVAFDPAPEQVSASDDGIRDAGIELAGAGAEEALLLAFTQVLRKVV